MASYEYDSQNQKLNRIAGGTLFSEMPIGSEIEYAGTTAPTGFLKCDGSTYSQVTYPELYAILGTTTLPNKSGYIIKAKQIGVPADFASAIENVIKKEYIVNNGNTLTGNGKYDLIKCGNVMELNIYNLSYASTVGDVCPVIIPEEYRPPHSFIVAGTYGSGSLSSYASVLFVINENGGVYSYTYSDFIATNSNNLHAVWTV